MTRDDIFQPGRHFGAIPRDFATFESARAVILPVPYDSTTDWRAGSRAGPSAIIEASQYMELYDVESGREIYRVGIHTLPDLKRVQTGPEAMCDQVYGACHWLLEQGKMAVLVGGEHSLSIGAIRAYAEKFPGLSVLQLDAHADLRDTWEETKYSHACVMRRVRDFCPVVPVGIRSYSLEESQFIRGSGIRPFYAADWAKDASLPEKVASALSPEVYVSLDMDVFDPSIMPAVGTPEPGGLGWYEVLSLLRLVSQRRRIVGFDIMELCPGEGPVACAYMAAQLLYKLTGYAIPKSV